MSTQSATVLSVGLRPLNAIALRNAVLCAECDVVSDSPHDKCLVCGSPSLFNISRILGGSLAKNRTSLTRDNSSENHQADSVLAFPKVHRVRRRVSA